MSQNTKIAGYNAEATPLTGVNPVHKIQFGVCITGRKDSDTPETVETKIVKDAESLSISVDGTIEEWNPMDQAGWVRRLMTAKSLGIPFKRINTCSISTKRFYIDYCRYKDSWV